MSISLLTEMKVYCTAEAVFEAFAEPEQLKKFWFSYSSGRWESGALISLAYPEYGAEAFDIRILRAEPGELIEFLWGLGTAEERKVSIVIAPLDNDSVKISVTEAEFDEGDIDGLIGNKGGWVFMLSCLKAYLENGVDSLSHGMFV